ncbi:MAG: hypothetical protein WCI62_03330, partial [Erysipelotrichaceae bacterium]
MKYLIKRSLRVIKDTFTQFLAIILIIAIGSAIFTGLLSTIRNLNTYLSDYYKDYHLADAWVYVSGMDSQELLDYQNQYPDVLIEGRYRFQVDSVLHGTSVTYRFIEPSDINRAQLITGSLAINDNEILIDRSFALTNGLVLDDALDIVIDNETYTFIITGLFESPEFAYKSKDNSDAA